MRRFIRWLLWPKGRSLRPGSSVAGSTIDVAPRASHAQPQSDRDIRPIVEALQRMDPKLDIIWNPRQHVLAKGSYSPLGKLNSPTYDGRWNVIRHQTENLHPERGDFAVICVLSEPSRHEGVLYLTKDGPYAPVGEWVVELMRSADAQNVRQFEALRKKLWDQHDRLDEAAGRINEAEAEEGLKHVLFETNYAGGVGRFQGRGAEFSPQSTKVVQ